MTDEARGITQLLHGPRQASPHPLADGAPGRDRQDRRAEEEGIRAALRSP